MKEYQLEGVRWLVCMHDRGLNAILADEMGLGKTLQTIAFLSFLKLERPGPGSGPSLIVVPLSVLTAWCGEFARWAPHMRVLRFHSGSREERDRLRTALSEAPLEFDAVVTTYEMITAPDTQRLLSNAIYWRCVLRYATLPTHAIVVFVSSK